MGKQLGGKFKLKFSQEKIQETLSSHHFREWWRVHVPKIFPPTPQMQYLFPLQHVDEADVNEMLLSPLERFLVRILCFKFSLTPGRI